MIEDEPDALPVIPVDVPPKVQAAMQFLWYCDQHEAVAEVCGVKHEVNLSEEEEATKSAALMVLRRYFQLPDEDAKAKAPRKPPKAHTRGKQTPPE